MAVQPSYYTQDKGQYRLIPGAGTYLQDQAKAQSAYERAKAQLMAQRQQKQISSGLAEDYSVDPHSQYGTYQQMLQGQGGELNAANEQAQQRGFFGPGLGNQGESALRYGHAVSALGFKNSLADYESQYQGAMGDIERQRQNEMLSALQSSAGYAFDQGDYTPGDYGNEPPYGGDYGAVGNLGMDLPPGQNYAPPIPIRPGKMPSGGYFPPKSPKAPPRRTRPSPHLGKRNTRFQGGK